MTKERSNCKHEYIHASSTFGADQGFMCRKCWQDAPPNVEALLYFEEAKENFRKAEKRYKERVKRR